MSMSLARYGALTKTFRYTLLVAALAGLTACGGGGGSGTSIDPPTSGGGTDKPGGGGTDSQLTISWEQPMDNVDGSVLNDLAGYRIYWGTAPGVYTDSVQVDDPTAISYTLDAPASGTYYFAATAYDDEAHEGPLSTVASIVID